MKKKILDVMIDFETFGRQPESVPINLAVVAWNRYAEENPFVIPGVEDAGEWPKQTLELPRVSSMPIFQVNFSQSRFDILHFDVADCLVEGMIVEPETQQWWMEHSATASEDLLLIGRIQRKPLFLMEEFVNWLSNIKRETKADEICIWSQGSDFDIAKLCWLISKYSIINAKDASMLLHYTHFRDARTVILELGNKLFDGKRGFSVDLATSTIFIDSKPNVDDELCDFINIYDKIIPMKAWANQLMVKEATPVCKDGIMSNYLYHLALGGNAHNSIYDCMQSIYNVWWLNKALDTQLI